MNLKQFEYFIKVAENKNFTRTAEEMFISQPALSQQIRSLEDEFGFPLLYRTNKMVELTPAGEFFYSQMKDIIEQCNLIISDTKKIAGFDDKKIIIGHFRPFTKIILPAILNSFNNKYKDYDLELTLNTSNQIYNDLLKRKIDIIFIDKNVIRNNLKDITFKKLFTTTLGLLTTKNNYLSKKDVLTFKDLQKQLLIIPKKKEVVNSYDDFMVDIKENLPGINIKYVSDFDSGLAMIRSTPNSICVSPDFKTRVDTSLIYIPFEKEYKLTYGIAYLTSNESAAIKKFVSTAKGAIKNLGFNK